MRTFLVALVAVALSPSLALAGGNKGNTIQVRNNGRDILAVIVDNGNALDTDFLDVASFVKAGGRLVPPGATIPIPVKFNTNGHTVFAAYIIDVADNFELGEGDDIDVFPAKGGTVKVTATEDADGDATLTGP